MATPAAASEWLDLAKTAVTAALSLVGVYVGYLLGIARDRTQQRQQFLERQVRDFYSPLVGYISRVRAIGLLRVEVSDVSGRVWSAIVERVMATHRPMDAAPKLNEEFKAFEALTEAENRELREVIIPLYDKMLALFTDNLWLAEPDTRAFYGEFHRFVALWHRALDGSIPPEVVRELEIKEERLAPFYANLEATLATLRKALASPRRVA